MRGRALRGAACAAVALAVAGCSQSSSGSSSAVTITGKTLHIYLSEPANLKSNPVAQDIVDAEKLAFLEHYSEVKDYKLVLIPVSAAEVSANARTAIQDTDAIAYLGELAPGDSDATVGITNAVELLQVSPTDTALELGQATPAVSGAPQSYYESWGSYGQTFARVVPSSDQEARAQVAEMHSLGVKSLYVAHDRSDYGKAIADAVESYLSHVGISQASSMGKADGIFYGAQSPTAAAAFFKSAASAAPSAKLFGPSSLNTPAFTSAAGSLSNLYVTIPGFMPKQLNSQGKGFERAFQSAYHHKPGVEAIFGFQAVTQLMNVLAQAGKGADDRETVDSDFLKSSETNSVLGAYKIDSSGDTNLDAFVIAHLVNGALVPFKAAPTGD